MHSRHHCWPSLFHRTPGKALDLSMNTPSTARRPVFLSIFSALVFAFIYLPILVLVVYSFNRDGVGGFPPHHFTFDWYRQLASDSSLWNSVLNSLFVAAGAVLVSLTLGLLAALALDRSDFPGKALFRRLVLLPLILPGIITGLSLLMFAVSVGLGRGLTAVFFGHGTALISVATTEIFAGLQKLDRRQEEASLDLGATPWRTFWFVTLPNLRLSLVAAGLLVFTLPWTKSPSPFSSSAATTRSLRKSGVASAAESLPKSTPSPRSSSWSRSFSSPSGTTSALVVSRCEESISRLAAVIPTEVVWGCLARSFLRRVTR